MKKTYLALEFLTGKLYEHLKEQQPESVLHTSATGKESYRRYPREVIGALDSVSLRDGNFGKQISMTLNGVNETFIVNLSLYDQKGNVDENFAGAFIAHLPALQKGSVYKFSCYNFIPEGEKYAKRGVSFKQGEEKIKKALTSAYTNKEGVFVDGDIPATVWKKDAFGKNIKSAASLEAINDYLLKVAVEQTERLKWTSGSYTPEVTAPAATPANVTNTVMQPSVTSEVDNDLPF